MSYQDDDPGGQLIKEAVIVGIGLINPFAGGLAQLADRFIALVQPNDAAVEAEVQRWAETESVPLAAATERMQASCTPEERQRMTEEADREPLRTKQILADHMNATLLAGDEKREALRRLTAARFDPRKPRETRDLYFKIAEGLSDAEIHGLLAIQSLPKGVRFEILETQVRPQSLHAVAVPLPAEVLDAIALLSHQHPELVPRRDAYYAMSALAVRLVAAMQAYPPP